MSDRDESALSGEERPRTRFGPGPRPEGGEGGDRGPRSGGRRSGGGGGRFGTRRKVCNFCADNIEDVDYKDIGRIRRHLSERGKIEPRRKLGTCARHQRSLTVAIKRSRQLALLPYVTGSTRG